MSVWHDGRLVAFDVETTGVDYDTDRIVTAAMVTVERLRVVDPLVIDKWLHRFRKGSRKLDAMCEHYSASLDGAHEAGADALAAARLAWVLGKRGVVVARPLEASLKELEWDEVRDDLDRLHAAQVGWADEQAVSLAEYFASQGKAQHVERAWPVVPS